MIQFLTCDKWILFPFASTITSGYPGVSIQLVITSFNVKFLGRATEGTNSCNAFHKWDGTAVSNCLE